MEKRPREGGVRTDMAARALSWKGNVHCNKLPAPIAVYLCNMFLFVTGARSFIRSYKKFLKKYRMMLGHWYVVLNDREIWSAHHTRKNQIVIAPFCLEKQNTIINKTKRKPTTSQPALAEYSGKFVISDVFLDLNIDFMYTSSSNMILSKFSPGL